MFKAETEFVAPSSQEERVVQFGAFQANLGSGELRKSGIKLKIHAQPFQVLAMLLEQPGKLIAREEIRQRLWPEDTFVDFDHGLNNAVNRLREVLGDSAATPRFIETVPRRGYRFIGTVNGGVQSGANEYANGTDPIRRRSPWLIGLTVAGSLVSLLVLLVYWKSPAQPSSRSFVLPPEGTTFNLIRDNSGPVALSADGTKLAFVATDARGASRIWIRPLSSLTAKVLEGTEGATFPFWSPDGRWIAFFSDSEKKLKKIAIEGGPAVALCDASFGRGGSWSRRGVIVFAPSFFSGLYTVSESGGTPAAVTRLDSFIHTSHRWPKFLPDGRHFLYLAVNHRQDFSRDGIYLGSIDGGASKRIVASHANAGYASGYLLFLSDEVLMAQAFDPRKAQLEGERRATVDQVVFDPAIWKAVFDVSENGVMAYQLGGSVKGPEMQWFDRAGTVLGTAGGPGFHGSPRLSPDGRKLLVGQAKKFGSFTDLWVYDLERNLGTRVFSEAEEDVGNGIWSNDGRQILFEVKGQQPNVGIYEMDAGGGGPKKLILETGNEIHVSDMSRNGKFLLYVEGSSDPEGNRLWVAPIRAAGKPFPLAERGNQEFGQFSPDGRWVAYSSRDSGRSEVYVVPFNVPANSTAPRGAGDKWQISSSGGTSPRWRGDGKELFFIGGDNTLMSVSIRSQSSTLSAAAPKPLYRASLSNTVVLISNPYDVSADGKKFIFSFGVFPESRAPVTLVQNWLSDLKQ